MANGAYVSPYRSPHQSFPQPDTGSVKVWRYLSLPKLISLLHSQRLHFIRADQLRDDFEGSVTRGVQEKWRRVERMSSLRLEMKRQVFASCWHENNADSEAMWRLYCGETDGVALKTSYETLDRSLPAGVFLQSTPLRLARVLERMEAGFAHHSHTAESEGSTGDADSEATERPNVLN